MRKPLKQFSNESKSILKNIRAEWRLSRLEEVYLRQGLGELDTALECEAKAKKEGLTLEDGNGRKYLNPLLTQAKIARNNYLRLMRLVGFEKALKEKVRSRPGRPTDSEIHRRENADEID